MVIVVNKVIGTVKILMNDGDLKITIITWLHL
jgi:hypothetical protein